MEKTPMAAGLRTRRPVDLLEPAVARVQDAEESRKSNGWEEISFFLFPHAADACWSCLEPPVKPLCPDSSAPGLNSALTESTSDHCGVEAFCLFYKVLGPPFNFQAAYFQTGSSLQHC
jgi:hypothetical protein